MSIQAREPRGVPTGGRFAPQTHAEADISLTPVDLSKVDVVCHGCGQTIPGSEYLDHDQFCNDESEDDAYWEDRANEEDPFVYPGRVAQHFEDQIARETELAEANGTNPYSAVSQPSWSSVNVGFGSRHARDLFERFNGDLDAAITAGELEWAAVAATPETRQRIVAAGHCPADFTSSDRNMAMSAAQSRGDLVFDNKLMSNAYDLSSHGFHTPGRVMGPPSAVTVAGEEVDWSDLPPSEQLAYIDGYTAGIEAIEHARRVAGPTGEWEEVGLRDRGPGPGISPDPDPSSLVRRRQGWGRAVRAHQWLDDFEHGRTTDNDLVTISYVNPDRRPMKVTHVTSDRGGFVGSPEPGRSRFNTDGGTVPYSSSARIHFTLDQVL